MRRTWDGLVLLLATLSILSGCAHEDRPKPPKAPENFSGPPPNDKDPRFDLPIQYPPKSLMQDLPRYNNVDPNAPNSPMRRNGSTGGATRGGY